HRTETIPLANVVGILPGKSKKNEYIIISAHYDHLGTGSPVGKDSIYNGADDDASGTTAVIMLANYFAKSHLNERTVIFAAFTAEELHFIGAESFSHQLNLKQVAAMVNIEMIGTSAKWGKGTAFITGFDSSSLGKLLQKNLENTAFQFFPDPYTELELFHRADNVPFSNHGVPAVTIATAQMDRDDHYHQVSDEIQTLDLKNMTGIIKAIAKSSMDIISGRETPARFHSADMAAVRE
ncbi:MAG: M28 family peptidase, partial [Flavisolibacter sp.]